MQASGSRSPLLIDCQYWARSEIQAPPEDPSEYAEYGTAVHSVAELLKMGQPLDMAALQTLHHLNDYDRDQAYVDGKALADWVTSNVPGNFFTERAYAFNTRTFTARVLESNGHRDYSSKLPEEYAGTLDLVAINGDTATVVDYKTGHTDAEAYREQLEFGALCVFLCNQGCRGGQGLRRIRCVVLKVDDGNVFPLQWEVDASDIDDMGLQIQAAFQAIPTSEPQPGPHCFRKFCPLAGTCPATTERLIPLMKKAYPDQLAEITPDDIFVDGSITNNSQALRLYELKRLMDKMGDQLDRSLKRYADQIGGLPVSHDKVWGPDESSREYVTLTPQAAELLKKELGPKYAAVEANLSKKSLKKACGARLEQVMDKLRAIGAAKPSYFIRYTERRAS